jgi:CBS domain-containing protein
MKLSAILKFKGGSILSVRPATRIADVIKLLAEKRIGAVLVTDADGKLEGILSERDIVRTLAEKAAATFEMTAEEMMTRSPKVTTPDATVAEAMELMTDGRFRHLPVMEGGKLVGLVSIGDVVKARISQQEMEVDSLRTYVSGGVS